jgi:DNA polymerase-3 subunit alpha
MEDLLRLAKDLRSALVATNDLHLPRARRHRTCGTALPGDPPPTTPTASSSTPNEFYLKSAAEMRLFRDHPGAAADNTLLHRGRFAMYRSNTATSCRAFRCPRGETEASWFEKK